MNYTAIYTTPPSVVMGMMCDGCGCMVRDSDRVLHDTWHARLQEVLLDIGEMAERNDMSGESDQEMLRRLIRQVMELSERMEES